MKIIFSFTYRSLLRALVIERDSDLFEFLKKIDTKAKL
jgi:hypothetical protein